MIKLSRRQFIAATAFGASVSVGGRFARSAGPEEPWAGGPSAQTAATGIIMNVGTVRPWAPPENQQIFKDSRDPSIVIPPSYDTAVHTSYIIVNRDTFSGT